jgi:hypothetical protein
MAQEANQPNQGDSVQVDNVQLDRVQQPSEQQPQPVPIPDAGNDFLNDPAIATTLSVDSITLPGAIGTLRRDELAYSIAQRNADGSQGR